MEFKFDLLQPEIRLVIDTEKGEQYIEASAEQLLAELHNNRQGELLVEIARAYTSENGQGCLADRIAEIMDESMTPAAATSLIKNLTEKYNL